MPSARASAACNDGLGSRPASASTARARDACRVASTDRLFATYDKLWEDFQRRKELFTDIEESKKFDFVNSAISQNGKGE